jgi:hypothetical protein
MVVMWGVWCARTSTVFHLPVVYYCKKFYYIFIRDSRYLHLLGYLFLNLLKSIDVHCEEVDSVVSF